MELVDSPTHTPGCCIQCRTAAGPLVDTQLKVWDEHLYFCSSCVESMATLVGGVGAVAHNALQEQLVTFERELDEKDAEIAKRDEALAQAERLREAVDYTLKHGIVETPETKDKTLRSKPGQKKVKTDKALQVVDGDGEDAAADAPSAA